MSLSYEKQKNQKKNKVVIFVAVGKEKNERYYEKLFCADAFFVIAKK